MEVNKIKKVINMVKNPVYLTQMIEYKRFGLKAKIKWFFFLLFTKDDFYLPK